MTQPATRRDDGDTVSGTNVADVRRNYVDVDMFDRPFATIDGMLVSDHRTSGSARSLP
jgi:hypothetical protein